MIPAVVRKSRFGEYATRRRETRNSSPRELVPTDIERGKLRKELQFAVRQVVVDPPRHRRPGNPFSQSIDQPRHDDARHGPHAAVCATLVPDMSPSIAFIGTAVLEMCIPVRVHLRRSICRSDCQTAERGLQRFKQIFGNYPFDKPCARYSMITTGRRSD